MQLLPDTRVTHGDPLISGVNFWDQPSESTPYLTYEVDVQVAGSYLVEMRALSSGTEDNGAHIGVNGNYPTSGRRVQWCGGKNQWTYSSALRLNSNHCGVPGSAKVQLSQGKQTIYVAARED
jgi:hypothetical protein